MTEVTRRARRSDALHYGDISRRGLCEMVARLESENTGLRRLAAVLCHCMQVDRECDDCMLNGAKGELAHDPLLACEGLHEMLRELGIEVE